MELTDSAARKEMRFEGIYWGGVAGCRKARKNWNNQ